MKIITSPAEGLKLCHSDYHASNGKVERISEGGPTIVRIPVIPGTLDPRVDAQEATQDNIQDSTRTKTTPALDLAGGAPATFLDLTDGHGGPGRAEMSTSAEAQTSSAGPPTEDFDDAVGGLLLMLKGNRTGAVGGATIGRASSSNSNSGELDTGFEKLSLGDEHQGTGPTKEAKCTIQFVTVTSPNSSNATSVLQKDRTNSIGGGSPTTIVGGSPTGTYDGTKSNGVGSPPTVAHGGLGSVNANNAHMQTPMQPLADSDNWTAPPPVDSAYHRNGMTYLEQQQQRAAASSSHSLGSSTGLNGYQVNVDNKQSLDDASTLGGGTFGGQPDGSVFNYGGSVFGYGQGPNGAFAPGSQPTFHVGQDTTILSQQEDNNMKKLTLLANTFQNTFQGFAQTFAQTQAQEQNTRQMMMYVNPFSLLCILENCISPFFID